jgi:gliding motility-associated-like protein
MKPTLKLLFVLLLLLPGKVKADHCAGAELVYEWVQDSTYKLIYKFYRDCSGISASTAVYACYDNSCNSLSGSITLNPITLLPDGSPNGSVINAGCPAFPSKCTLPTSSIPGYQEWWYEGLVTLPFRCSAWRFAVSQSVRNSSGNLGGNANLSVEAVLNNVLAQGNSSPYFSVKPVPYVCINQSYTYNNGAIDINNDSFAYTIIQPQSVPSFNGCQQLIPVTFKTGTPPYNLTTNPFQTNNSFTLNQITGNINFTPQILGGHTVAIKVSEYRNHHLIGYVERDIQIQVLNCSSSAVNMNIPSATMVNAVMVNGIINACSNKPFSFCYDLVAVDTDAILLVKDNHIIATPLASINYSAQATDSIRGCFSWFPTINDTGLKVISIQVKDSTCRPPGVAVVQTYTVPIRINSTAQPPQVTSPVYYCVNDIPGPLPVQGINLLWYNNPFGGTGSSTAPAVNTMSASSTTYYVSQNATGCESNRVPITIIVKPTPKVKIIIGNDSLCQFDKMPIRNIDTSLSGPGYSWSVDTANYTGNSNNSVIIASWKTSGWKKVIITADLNNCFAKDSASIFIVRMPAASFEVKHDICLADTANIIPEKQDGYYHWKIDEIFVNDTDYISPLKLSWATPGLKKLSLTLINNFNCFSTYDSTVYVHELPAGKITATDNNTCSGGTISFHTPKNNYYVYEWTPQIFFDQNYLPDVIATVPYSTNIFLKVTNQWGCIIRDSAYVNTDICCRVLLPDAFTPNGDGLNDKYHILTLPGQLNLDVFMIADRWGKIVFKTTSINEGWDGTYKNQPVDMDTYFYYVKYSCDKTEGIKKGAFNLIR